MKTRPWLSAAQRRRQRGGAVVETAIMMLVIVPTMMYTFFLDDLLRYKLDVQEAVFSTPWDYAVAEYSADPELGSIDYWARRMWCDHVSTYDSYDKKYDCTDEWHHRTEGAHICWLAKVSPAPGETAPPAGSPKADQVRCSQNKDVGKPSDTNGLAFHDEYTKGGMMACKGRVGVLNYFLPAMFFPQFSDEKMTEATKFKKGPGQAALHENAKSNIFASRKAFFLEEERFAVVSDSWALNESPDYQRDQTSGKFIDRVATIYKGTNSTGLPLATAFETAAKIYVKTQDDLEMPNLAVRHAVDSEPPGAQVAQSGSNTEFYATPWKDWDSDEAEATWNERQKFYMGAADY